MVTDTVGLDIGHTAIKAVRFRRTLAGRETVTYFKQEIQLAAQETIGERAEILKQFVQTYRLADTRIMTAIPCGDLFIRTLTLPFDDSKKLAQVVPGEVESRIPLPLEEVAVDYQLLTHPVQTEPAKQGTASQVLVAVAQKSMLATHVRRLADAGIDPCAIQVDALALLSLARHLTERQSRLPSDLAIIDIGASKTTICLIYQKDPWLVRTVRCGTDDLMRGTVKEAALPSEAERHARTWLPEQMEPAFSRLVRELRTTLHAYEASTHKRLRSAWFCGGGAELKDLAMHLAQRLGLEHVSLPQLYHARCSPAYAVAFGLAVMGPSIGVRSPLGSRTKGSQIDLKRVMNTTVAQRQGRRRLLWQIGLAGLVIVLLAVADLFVQAMLKEARLQELKTELRSQFRAQFPGIKVVTDELDQAKSLVQATRKTHDLLGGDQPQMLSVLADVVRNLPKGVLLKVGSLTIEPMTIQIEAETDSFESVEKIKRGLLTLPGVREVTVHDARVGSTPNQVLCRITVNRDSA